MNRFRRLRATAAVRDLVRETVLTPHDFIQPFFVMEGRQRKQEVASMPGVFRYTGDLLIRAAEKFHKKGGRAIILFGIPSVKNTTGSEAYKTNGVVQKTVRALKKYYPDLVVFTDVCLCGYMKHGHCGIVEKGQVDNDKTIKVLGKVAVSHAAAGADFVAPSDMMDFRVRQIRMDLDKNGFDHTGILSYAVKYASAYYGPFRDAAGSAPGFGDRRSYQMDPANVREALKEARQDVAEGADMIMVKPALAYLDVVSRLKQEVSVPVVAYNVSGEYAMVKAASAKKWIAEREVVLESLTSMKRAGADVIITYFAESVLGWL